MDTVARLAPIASVGATRTSHRWVEPPGNWDRLNCRALFASGNEWGIPDLPVSDLSPARLGMLTEKGLNWFLGRTSGDWQTDIHRFE